jgi:hypothetical protein
MGFRFRRSARVGPLRFHFTASGLSSISLGGHGANLNLPVNRRGGPRTTVSLPGSGLSWSIEHGDRAPAHRHDDRTIEAAPLQDGGSASVERKLMASDRAHRPAEARENPEPTRPVAPGPDGEVSIAAPRNQPPGTGALPNSRRLRSSQLQALRLHCLELFHQQLFKPGSQARQLWEQALVSRLLDAPGLAGRLAGQLALIETPEALAGYLERSRSQNDLKRRCQRCLAATETALRLCGQQGWLG